MKLLRRLAAALLLLAGFAAGLAVLYPLRYIGIITEFSEKYNLPPELVCAVINTESRFRPDAVSPKNASGLMQLMKETADWGADVLDLENYDFSRVTEPRLNIELGCWYLSALLREFKQETNTALAAYNAGSGNVTRWLADKSLSSDGIRLDDIPYGETKRYVGRVNQAIPIYRVMLQVFGEK